jgi:hypothetical protein
LQLFTACCLKLLSPASINTQTAQKSMTNRDGSKIEAYTLEFFALDEKVKEARAQLQHIENLLLESGCLPSPQALVAAMPLVSATAH